MLRQFAGLWLVVFRALAALARLARACGQLGHRVWRSPASWWASGAREPAGHAADLHRLDDRGVSDRLDGLAGHGGRVFYLVFTPVRSSFG